MNSIYNLSRRKKIIAFSFVFLSTSIMTAFFLSSLLNNDNRKAIHDAAELYNPAIAANTVRPADIVLLNDRLDMLQQFDNEYARLLVSGENKNQLDTLNNMIINQEKIFQDLVEHTFSKVKLMPSSYLKQMMSNTILGYKSILKNRSSISYLHDFIASDNLRVLRSSELE